MTDRSNIGAWLGLVCVALALLPWIPCDLWLKHHHHRYITTEFRRGLQEAGPLGLIMCGVIGFVLGVALYHFFYQRNI